MSFTLDDRNHLVRSFVDALAANQAAALRYDRSGGTDAEAEQILDATNLRIRALIKAYRAGVPRIAIARCPLCRAENVHSLDVFGLDGLWWNVGYTIRPDETGVCPHYVTISGAMRLASPVEKPPFLVRPGPEVPYVNRSLMADPAILATMACVTVGSHSGFVATYFSPTGETKSRVPMTWSSDRREHRMGNRVFLFEDELDPPSNHDFDLAPWLQTGRLLWIAPGDAALVLRTGPDGCSYVALPGGREVVYLSGEKRWTPSTVEQVCYAKPNP